MQMSSAAPDKPDFDINGIMRAIFPEPDKSGIMIKNWDFWQDIF